MSKITILALFLTKYFSLAAQQAEQLRIGTAFKDISEIYGYQNLSSTAVNLHFGVNHVKTFTDNHYFVVSKFEDGHLGTNDYQMRVVGVVDIPQFREEYFSVKLKNCSLSGRLDDSLFAMVVTEEKRQLNNVLKAWKLNRKTGELISISTNGVSCYNENWVAYSGN